jgi:NAD(P)H-quinone oxidoreductase subunit 5
MSIQYIVHNSQHSTSFSIALGLLFLGVMIQSALWPFHKWLISSMNAPTPVSAMMHAGVINGGGFLLARFSPLYLKEPRLLSVMFIAGIITALIGNLWKLMQNDVKRMLACSTMSQMGFMIAQCGLGLFPAAVSHFCWHGLFKAYLFLKSGGYAHENRIFLKYPPKAINIFLSFVLGFLSLYIFSRMAHYDFTNLDTTIISATQLSLTVLEIISFRTLAVATIFMGLIGIFYAGNILMFEFVLAPLNMMGPQPLNFLHCLAMGLLFAGWLFILFFNQMNRTKEASLRFSAFYVKMLNLSQPAPETITAHRNDYKYL